MIIIIIEDCGYSEFSYGYGYHNFELWAAIHRWASVFTIIRFWHSIHSHPWLKKRKLWKSLLQSWISWWDDASLVDIDIWVMDIHNWIMSGINWAMYWDHCISNDIHPKNNNGYPSLLTLVHNSVTNIHNWIMDTPIELWISIHMYFNIQNWIK